MKKLLTGIGFVFALVALQTPAFADCDTTYSTAIQRDSGGDELVICGEPGDATSGTFDFRGFPTKANITADTTNPTDTSVITVQLQEDDENNLERGSVVDVYIADTNVIGNGITAPDGATGKGGVVQLSGDAGTILNERVTDGLFTLETNTSGKAVIRLNEGDDTNRWVNVVMPTGQILQSPKIDFD